MAVLAIVAACLGCTTHSLFLSELMVLFTIGFVLGKILHNLHKIVSLLELQAMSNVVKNLARLKVDCETAQAIANKAKEAKENLERLKSKISEPCKAPEQETTNAEEK